MIGRFNGVQGTSREGDVLKMMRGNKLGLRFQLTTQFSWHKCWRQKINWRQKKKIICTANSYEDNNKPKLPGTTHHFKRYRRN